MRDHIRNRGIAARPEQLELLVPAFDLAWKAVEARGGFLLAGNDLSAFRDRVARAVVDVVTAGGDADAEAVAAEVVKTVLADRPPTP